MKRLKGPELKKPDLKVPQPLVDLYRDLDERHLIPVVAILAVAIVAIPLLLGGSDESTTTDPAAEAGASASIAPSSKQSAMVVAKATPRLRKYERRLDHLQPKNPFRPHYASPEGASGEAESSTEVSTSTTESTTVETGGSDSSGSTTSPDKESLTFFTWAIDVRVAPVSSNGNPSDADPEVRRDLPSLVMLPSRSTPALTYVGPSRDEKKAIMLVSDDVTALFGDSNCVVGSESCQMLALEPGLPETVVFGPQARTYRIELLKMHLLASDHLNRAKLGDPKQSKQTPKPKQEGKDLLPRISSAGQPK